MNTGQINRLPENDVEQDFMFGVRGDKSNVQVLTLRIFSLSTNKDRYIATSYGSSAI